FCTTIFLFSKSDIAPILGPSLVVAMVLAGPTDIIAFIMGFSWLELHLLTFEVHYTVWGLPVLTAQPYITGLEEDRLSKPSRPIVAGRLSVAEAQKLYLAVGALSLVWSMYHGVLLRSVVYMVAIYCYNEGGMSRHWFLKSFLGSIGYGTTIIFDHGMPLSNISITAIIISGLLHTTTGHAQDFRDRPGDAAIGRKTLPLLLPPHIARWSLALLMAAWTILLVYLWALPLAAALFFGL
ncbi:UbiA prenyltransferase family-domain-containing protein, partial [Mycena galopus ATCC 62051]